MELYTSIQKHPFQFIHCWRELKDAPKWRIDSSKKKSKTPYKSGHASSSPASSIPSSPDTINLGEDDIARDTFSEGLERPIGRKATKELLRKGKGKRAFDTSMPMTLKFEEFVEKLDVNNQKRQEQLDRIYAQEQEKILIKKEKLRLEQQREDERIMSIDTSNMDPMQAEYYKQLKMRIIAKGIDGSFN